MARWVPALLYLFLCGAIHAASLAAQTAPEERTAFGASYADLSGEQRALVDDFFRRASTTLGVTLDPRERYDDAPLSSRTTFDAVTHALFNSTLTDRDTGQPLGRTLDLVDYIETVHGQIDGTNLDKQFRLYVTLKPGAREKLDLAKEFTRVTDNAFFHEGYPLSYRQSGWPSLHVSMSRDAARGDIDVDYRPGRFPSSLVSGQLTADNSDVRAGNLERHNDRWSGLVNWWDGFLRSMFAADVDVPRDAPRVFPSTPRAGGKTIDVAIEDFLTSWLIDRRPNVAVAYFDRQAYDCLAARLERDGHKLDRTLAPVQVYARMKAVAETLGPERSLKGTTTGVRLSDPTLKTVQHKHQALYSIYAVPSAVAERWSCDSDAAVGAETKAPSALSKREVDDTFYTTATIGGSDYATAALGLLWQRRNGQWKIVSYQAAWDDVSGTQPIPDLRRPSLPFAPARINAEPSLAQAADRFLDAWLIRKEYDEALTLVLPAAYPCVNLFLDRGNAPKTSATEQLASLRRGLERVSAGIGSVERLEGIIHKVEPVDPRLRVVDHPHSAAFGLLGVPDWMGPTMFCDAPLVRSDTTSAEDRPDQAYGKYFVEALRFVNTTGEGAVLALGWVLDGQSWRIYSLKIVDS